MLSHMTPTLLLLDQLVRVWGVKLARYSFYLLCMLLFYFKNDEDKLFFFSQPISSWIEGKKIQNVQDLTTSWARTPRRLIGEPRAAEPRARQTRTRRAGDRAAPAGAPRRRGCVEEDVVGLDVAVDGTTPPVRSLDSGWQPASASASCAATIGLRNGRSATPCAAGRRPPSCGRQRRAPPLCGVATGNTDPGHLSPTHPSMSVGSIDRWYYTFLLISRSIERRLIGKQFLSRSRVPRAVASSLERQASWRRAARSGPGNPPPAASAKAGRWSVNASSSASARIIWRNRVNCELKSRWMDGSSPATIGVPRTQTQATRPASVPTPSILHCLSLDAPRLARLPSRLSPCLAYGNRTSREPSLLTSSPEPEAKLPVPG